MSRILTGVATALFSLSLLACSQEGDHAPGEDAHAHGAEAEAFERGPHNGRMLREGDFALEVTIFEDGVPPEFRVYAYEDGRPIDPAQADLVIALTRLDGQVDRFAFAPMQDFLRGEGVVTEPHSFDVTIQASHGGVTHRWDYESHEGRTIIAPDAAAAGGVTTERAGPAAIAETLDLAGRVELTPEGRAEVHAWYPGRIVSLTEKTLGDSVERGETLARVESAHSLQTYAIPAPLGGVIVAKAANVGGVAGDAPLFEIADPVQLHAEYFLYPRDAERVRVGQTVEVRSLSGETRLTAPVEAILPDADPANQTVMAHVHLPPEAAETLRPGMAVEGSFRIAETQVPLAVRTRAIQRFRDFDVVFEKIGDTYEVRMLELGRRTSAWTEVLGGLKPGAEYVVDGAFLIRADIEKAGASHDH